LKVSEKGLIVLPMWPFVLFLISCVNYQFQSSSNPFGQYDIHSVAIPNMVSYASLPGLGVAITREIKLLLSSYADLTIYSGEHMADAILVGLITSGETKTETFIVKERQYVESFGARRFYVPTLLNYDVGLRLVLIKNPKIGGVANGTPTIIFDRFMAFTKVTERAIDEGPFTFTQNKKIIEKSVEELAVEMATSFREVILNAF
jgi:hypothetical protein